MASITFDTHFFIKKLVSQGMPEKQAEAVVEVIRETKEADLNVMSTKADLRELEIKLEQKILESKITLIQWMVGLLFLQAGLIITVLKMQ